MSEQEQQLKVVKVTTDDTEANVVAGFLRSQGIECVIATDDAGHTFPSLDEVEGIQILVRLDDAPEAERLLAEREAESASEESTED